MQDALKPYSIRLADWTSGGQEFAIQHLLTVATQPGILSFALGLPAEELFPAAAYARATYQALLEKRQILQYGPPWQPLKKQIVELMALRGVTCREEQVFLTTGAQQGMSLLSRLLLNPGGRVLLEETVYSGIVQATEALRPLLLPVPAHPQTGVDVEAVERMLRTQARPAFLYLMSDGHNPLGVSLSPGTRQRLVALARSFQVPIIEDDVYGLLTYEEVPALPMRALDEEWVLYLGSFSKILAPALRVGWIIAPATLVSLLSSLKEGSDINTATFAQRTIAAYLEQGHFPEHLNALRQEYRLRRDTMLQALEQYFPATAHWSVPAHGLFIWVEFAAHLDMFAVLRAAVEEQRVAFVPGQAFSVGGSHQAAHAMRLNFSRCNPEEIVRGMALLGQVLTR